MGISAQMLGISAQMLIAELAMGISAQMLIAELTSHPNRLPGLHEESISKIRRLRNESECPPLAFGMSDT